MRKQYVVFQVEEFRKRYTSSTRTHLKKNGYCAESFDEGFAISGELILTTPDDETPDFTDCFLVTVEPISAPEGTKDKWTALKEIIDGKVAEDNGASVVRRKFR